MKNKKKMCNKSNKKTKDDKNYKREKKNKDHTINPPEKKNKDDRKNLPDKTTKDNEKNSPDGEKNDNKKSKPNKKKIKKLKILETAAEVTEPNGLLDNLRNLLALKNKTQSHESIENVDQKGRLKETLHTETYSKAISTSTTEKLPIIPKKDKADKNKKGKYKKSKHDIKRRSEKDVNEKENEGIKETSRDVLKIVEDKLNKNEVSKYLTKPVLIETNLETENTLGEETKHGANGIEQKETTNVWTSRAENKLDTSTDLITKYNYQGKKWVERLKSASSKSRDSTFSNSRDSMFSNSRDSMFSNSRDSVYKTSSTASYSTLRYGASTELDYSSVSPECSGQSSAELSPRSQSDPSQELRLSSGCISPRTPCAGARAPAPAEGEWSRFWQHYNLGLTGPRRYYDQCPTPYRNDTFDVTDLDLSGDGTRKRSPDDIKNINSIIRNEGLHLTPRETQNIIKCAHILGNVLTKAIERRSKEKDECPNKIEEIRVEKPEKPENIDPEHEFKKKSMTLDLKEPNVPLEVKVEKRCETVTTQTDISLPNTKSAPRIFESILRQLSRTTIEEKVEKPTVDKSVADVKQEAVGNKDEEIKADSKPEDNKV